MALADPSRSGGCHVPPDAPPHGAGARPSALSNGDDTLGGTVNHEGFENAYRSLRPAIERQMRRDFDATTAADLTAETFAVAWQSQYTYDPSRGSEAQWIHGIARHVRAQHRRALARGTRSQMLGPADGHEDSTIDRVDAALAAGVLIAAIAALGVDDMQVIGPIIVASLGGLELSRRSNAEHLRLFRVSPAPPGSARGSAWKGLSCPGLHASPTARRSGLGRSCRLAQRGPRGVGTFPSDRRASAPRAPGTAQLERRADHVRLPARVGNG